MSVTAPLRLATAGGVGEGKSTPCSLFRGRSPGSRAATSGASSRVACWRARAFECCLPERKPWCARWLGHEPLRGGGRYVVQHAARRTLATVESDGPLGARDIGQARIALHAPPFVDAYDAVHATGAPTVIDEAADQAVGAGLVR